MLRKIALATLVPLMSAGLAVVTLQSAATAAGPGAEVYFINSDDGGQVSIHNAARWSSYSQFGLQTMTPQSAVNSARYSRAMGDYDGDGINDLYVVDRDDAGRTSVHILDGASNFQWYLHHTRTPLPALPASRYAFSVGDWDGDGRADLFAIDRADAGATSVHVLTASSNYDVIALSTRTPLWETSDEPWSLNVGDFDRDGRADLYAIHDSDGPYTAVHILTGASNFQSFAARVYTGFGARPGANWQFRVGDYNGDGHADIYAINTSSNGRTDVHVMGASSASSSLPFQEYLLHTVSAIHDTPTQNWDVQIGAAGSTGRAVSANEEAQFIANAVALGVPRPVAEQAIYNSDLAEQIPQSATYELDGDTTFATMQRVDTTSGFNGSYSPPASARTGSAYSFDGSFDPRDAANGNCADGYKLRAGSEKATIRNKFGYDLYWIKLKKRWCTRAGEYRIGSVWVAQSAGITAAAGVFIKDAGTVEDRNEDMFAQFQTGYSRSGHLTLRTRRMTFCSLKFTLCYNTDYEQSFASWWDGRRITFTKGYTDWI